MNCTDAFPRELKKKIDKTNVINQQKVRQKKAAAQHKVKKHNKHLVTCGKQNII